MRSVTSAISGTASYDYDAFGRRVRSTVGGKATLFVYDAEGRLTAEYEAGFTGPLQPHYVTPDRLGSTRLVTDGAGAVLRRADYLPLARSCR